MRLALSISFSGVRTFSEDAAPPVIITQNGEAKAVLVGVQEYEHMQETLAMLKALSFSGKNLEAGKGHPAREVFADMRRHEGRKAE